ncbi:LOW QUALITY PROTEIN: Hypothetical protein PHPALM_13872 [Phytophthora palmivora]|uniref:Uncharacterized protein n=1 Tax=Phytophthora palmivora TaxID=4796 RepID=A0A2P4XW90_9STRA|nr:LOW QUALITY PROTEIN: Hypothetical protein PHPALM_13872 [Phytophthora palmivora]
MIPDHVAQYFSLFERIIMDNGLQDNLGRGSAADDNYVARMKQRTKPLVDNLSPTMLRDEIKGMLELVKYRHIRINDQLLYRLVLERAELQQLFYNRFKQQGPTTTAPKTNVRKGNKGAAAIDNSRRTELQHRSSSRGGQKMTDSSPDATTRKNVAEIPHRRPPPKPGCFHCKGEHWLKDCPLATPEEKEEVRSTKSKYWKWKFLCVLILGQKNVFCLLEQLKSAGQELIMKTLENPVPVIGVGGKVTHSHETALVDLQIRTAVGPVNLYKIKCVVVEGEDQFLLSKVIMKRLGIDVKQAFEQFANTCIDLNLDDIPNEPDWKVKLNTR